jgi:cobyric acid synthase
VPYIKQLNLPEEDSVEFKDGRYGTGATDGPITVTVVDLAHISNFTDFDPFRLEPDVTLRVAREPGDLDGADAVMLPGSKNVIGDLRFLRQTGLRDRLERIAESGEAVLVGVCAGLQMLGRHIADPHRLESDTERMEGIGALPVSTVLAEEKTLMQIGARHMPSGEKLRGYEIHHGRTQTEDELDVVIEREDGEPVGFARPDGSVWGTYLHGVFDADTFRRWFIDRLRQRRGLDPLGGVTATYDLEPAFDRLADVVRESLDIGRIYELMGLA